MKKFLKIVLVLAAMILALLCISGCDDKNKDTNMEAVGTNRETLEVSLRASAGNDVNGKTIKQMIGDIIDYNNSADDRIFVEYMETEYTEIVDLNGVCDLLIDDNLYDVKTQADEKGSIYGIMISEKVANEINNDMIIIDEDEVEQ